MNKQVQSGKDDVPPQPSDTTEDAQSGLSPSLDRLVGEYEEEESVDGQTVRRKGIYLLPNLFTTGTLFAGFYAIIAAMRGHYEAASLAIFLAMLFDGLDGRVARLTNTSSKFGAEYDSLADMVSFGVAPALVMFSWALGGLGKFGWSVAFIFVACAALRLARFNTQIDTADKNFFTGLASPAAASVIASAVWVCHDAGLVGAALPSELAVVMGLLTAVIGFLMIANFPYYSFKSVDFKSRVPFVVMIAMILVFGLVMLDPPRVLLIAFLAYAVSGPVAQIVKWRRQA